MKVIEVAGCKSFPDRSGVVPDDERVNQKSHVRQATERQKAFPGEDVCEHAVRVTGQEGKCSPCTAGCPKSPKSGGIQCRHLCSHLPAHVPGIDAVQDDEAEERHEEPGDASLGDGETDALLRRQQESQSQSDAIGRQMRPRLVVVIQNELPAIPENRNREKGEERSIGNERKGVSGIGLLTLILLLPFVRMGKDRSRRTGTAKKIEYITISITHSVTGDVEMIVGGYSFTKV